MATEPPDLAAELQEIDFFAQQGLRAEARVAVRNLLALYPAHPQLLDREVALRAPAVAPAQADDDATFDLGRELADELGGFEEPAPDDGPVPHGPTIQTAVQVEDGETHYDLGIAYKEMGLIDDALHEFEVARDAHPPKSAVECLMMIGLCRLEKGDAPAAVEAWRRALATRDIAPEAVRALNYELARAYQHIGDGEAALWYLNKVLRAEPRFRDARALAARLGDGPGRPPPGDPDAAPGRSAAKKIGYV